MEKMPAAKEMRLKALDLFSGVGGNSLGLFDMVDPIAYCEADKHAQAVLYSQMRAKILKLCPIFSDVKTLRACDLPNKPDIIVAGFPCQDISVAGKGEGIREGNRSGLFYEIMRLTDEIQPRFLFLENVPAIRTRGLDIVLQELTQRGYDCRWTMLQAAHVGAPHKRERWFMLAVRRSENSSNTEHTRWDGTSIKGSDRAAICNCEKRPDSASQSERMDTPANVANTVSTGNREKSRTMGGESEKGKSDKTLPLSNCSEIITSTDQRDNNRRTIKSRLGGMAHGISDRLDKSLPEYLERNYWEKEPEDTGRVTLEKCQRVERIKRLGNAVVPLQARQAFKILMGLK